MQSATPRPNPTDQRLYSATHSAYTKLWDSMRLHAKVYFVALSTYADASRTRQPCHARPDQAKMKTAVAATGQEKNTLLFALVYTLSGCDFLSDGCKSLA